MTRTGHAVSGHRAHCVGLAGMPCRVGRHTDVTYTSAGIIVDMAHGRFRADPHHPRTDATPATESPQGILWLPQAHPDVTVHSDHLDAIIERDPPSGDPGIHPVAELLYHSEHPWRIVRHHPLQQFSEPRLAT